MENKKDLKIEKFLQTIANNNNLNKSNNYNVWNRLNQNLDIYENKIPEFNSYNSFNEKKKKEINLEPKITGTLPMPFIKSSVDKISDINFNKNEKVKDISLEMRRNTVESMPFINKHIDRIPTMDTFNPGNKY